MGLGQLARSRILGALAQPSLEPGERARPPTLQLPDRHAELPGDGLDRLPPQQAQHHLVLAGQAPALTRRERTSLSGLPCDGQHGRAALALAAHTPSRTGHRLSITFHAVCPPASRNNTVSKETAGSSIVWPRNPNMEVIMRDYARPCCTDQREGAVILRSPAFRRYGQTSGVQTPACGSGPRRRRSSRWPDAGPCASATRRRSPV